MRCEQFIGLNERAAAYLDEFGAKYETITRRLDNGEIINRSQGIIKKELVKNNSPNEEFDPQLYTEVPMHVYEMKDGSYVHSFEQCSIWSGGPNVFIALRKEDGTIIEESLWTQEEIDRYS